MKFGKLSHNKGSMLVAVIGVLAVLSIMAIRFNNEMEMAMVKASSKNVTSDVRVIANSGLQYIIAKLLADGKSCDGNKGTTTDSKYTQLAIEEQSEMYNKGAKTTPIDMGSGVSELVEGFNANNFYNGVSSSSSSLYIPLAESLAPGNINFMIEDLSGKLPIGHVSQWYQRLLISATLCKLLTNQVPKNFNAELFEDTNSTEVGGYDDYNGRSIALRSLVPFEMAKSMGNEHKDAFGLPIPDGLLVTEELGSAYTWIKGPGSKSATKHANDIARNSSDYRLLSGALTPFARFTYPENNLNSVSFASINPLVMSRQNSKLFKSLFNFEPNDDRLKMYFSVGFGPDPAHNNLTKDDPDKGAMADPKYFETSIDANMLSTAYPLNVNTTSGFPLPFTYNARNLKTDLRALPTDPKFLLPNAAALVKDDTRYWSDGEFLNVPNKTTAYYIAMDKACDRLARAFKGTPGHSLPADGVMSPIVTRKALELAIIKAVFGDSILLVITDDIDPDPAKVKKVFLNDYGANLGVGDANAMGNVNYYRLHKALELPSNDPDGIQWQLDNVIFVENGFQDSNDSTMAKDYFVSNWKDYNIDVKGAIFNTVSANANVVVPTLGFYYDDRPTEKKYKNYLPHPQTDQRGLSNSFVTIGAAYSHKNALAEAGGGTNISKLYEIGSSPVNFSKMNSADVNEAYLDISTLPGSTSVKNTALPIDNYIKLYQYDVKDPNPNLVPANFAPYETKIRMAVLVNLLNAIIPKEVTPTRNSIDSNSSFFPNTAPKNNSLTTFINFVGNQYVINQKGITGSTDYMNGWTGGIQTPGMTFWKFGVHSTTFQCTIDAFKYDEACRLTAVVTFDNCDYSGKQFDDKTYKYDLKSADLTKLRSNIFLNPNGRKNPALDYDSIGQGLERFPSTSGANRWRILSYVWTAPYARGVGSSDFFTTITATPFQVCNVGAPGGSWYFNAHTLEPSMTKFFYGNSYASDAPMPWPAPNPPRPKWNAFGMKPSGYDYTRSVMNGDDPLIGQWRVRSYGAGSWLKWKKTVGATMPANSLKLSFFREGANANSKYKQDHLIEIMTVEKNEVVFSWSFSSISDGSYQSEYFKVIDKELKKGEYYIKLTEINESNNKNNYGDEVFVQITISEL